ncbi:sigma 54-interacting transcriptional regulator [Desulfuromonas sp. TF]|uniref:sigma-54-dependent Fis family transcriptional regulator n=1 Tax=Desulfuromonas sp. TF TaxID=1232410 RepID=UPI00042581C6|nr:sigma 54-interacting transcriptional regulator [Desulfuromonas sp. TF]
MILPSAIFFQEEFDKLAQSCQETPYALAVLDRDLRYVQVNEPMAALNGKPVEQHRGRTIREIDPGVASAVEPLLRHAMEEGKPLLNLESEVSRSPAADAPDIHYWLISCYPLKSEDGTVVGVGAVVRNITEQKLKDSIQNERLKFEALLSDLSAAFINVPVGEVDRKIEQGLEKIAEFLEFDRCSIWQFSPEDGPLRMTHSYALPGISLPPPVVDEQVPVWTNMVRRGEMFKVADVDQLPDKLWREKKYCREQGGIKSFLFIPLNIGGTVFGLLSFASYRVKRTWPDVLIQRLRLLWEIFGNALERKRADQRMQTALAEIEQLKNRLEAENLYLRDQIDIEQKHEEIIGQSVAIRKVLLQVEQVANTDATVLLLGETGTGKELLARAIHNLSGRRARAMIKLNCAALPSTLIEAELFGREKGAYTGAMATQIGRFEAANGSTIFLDEIGEIPLDLQAKLLRVLQEGQLERLGSPQPIEVDVRIIAATNRDLSKAVKEGRFREDLYYRLNVFPISVPPLRDRREDIPLLVWAIVREFGSVFGKTIERIPKKNMEALECYLWPGNIRELRNMIERAMILSNSSTLVVDLPDNSPTSTSQNMSLEEMERMHIVSIMERTGWRVRGKNGAAEILDLKPTTLDSKMKKLGIKRTVGRYEIS